jgi:hypothetical protein
MVQVKHLNVDEIRKGKAHFAELIKILFFKQNEELISLLDIDNDDVFLDPIIYAYFSSDDAEGKVTLEQLAYGYIADQDKPDFVNAIIDGEGVLYIPKIGYFKFSNSALHNQKCKFYFNQESYKVTHNDNVVEFEFFPLLFADSENKIEIVQFQHPLLKDYFKVLRPGYPNQGEACDVEIHEIAKFQQENLKKAISFIKKHFPQIYETIVESNKKVVIFGNQAMLPFASQNTLGISYISSLYTDSYVFFIEEILHQASHNLFRYMSYDKPMYFKIDVENELLGKYLGNPNEKRNIYNVFHGVITITQRLICYKYIIENNLLTGIDLHELHGRYCDQYRRHHAGLEKIDFDLVYTDLGKSLYTEMDKACEDSLRYFMETSKKYKVKDQPSEFNFQQFLALNPFKN